MLSLDLRDGRVGLGESLTTARTCNCVDFYALVGPKYDDDDIKQK